VVLLGLSEGGPIDADAATAMDCADPPPHSSQHVFSSNLGQLVCASATGCTSQMPCP
jgi:hypothetical protein